jgi:hypothetical protein
MPVNDTIQGTLKELIGLISIITTIMSQVVLNVGVLGGLHLPLKHSPQRFVVVPGTRVHKLDHSGPDFTELRNLRRRISTPLDRSKVVHRVVARHSGVRLQAIEQQVTYLPACRQHTIRVQLPRMTVQFTFERGVLGSHRR